MIFQPEIPCNRLGGLRPTTREICMTRVRAGAFLLCLSALASLAGCGMPAQPLAPTLKLPLAVKDLRASRSANTVSLSWTMPTRTTDNTPLEGKVPVYVWRSTSDLRRDLVGDFSVEPGKPGEYSDVLPADMQSGPQLSLNYAVELLNHTGHSVGLSNMADSAAGAAPPAIMNLTAKLAEDGVQLHWEAAAAATGAVRIHRKLLDAPSAKSDSAHGSEQEPAVVSLLVPATNGKDFGAALDKSATFGRHYQYWVERVLSVHVAGHEVEISSSPSNTVNVDTKDVFPPKPPQQVVAVATEGAVDLSWAANTEPDLAGYIVYRSDSGSNPERISPPGAPLIAPAFRDTSAKAGHTYRYSVSAVDTNGNESSRSTDAEETLPQ
jgi:hypothetical protein